MTEAEISTESHPEEPDVVARTTSESQAEKESQGETGSESQAQEVSQEHDPIDNVFCRSDMGSANEQGRHDRPATRVHGMVRGGRRMG